MTNLAHFNLLTIRIERACTKEFFAEHSYETDFGLNTSLEHYMQSGTAELELNCILGVTRDVCNQCSRTIMNPMANIIYINKPSSFKFNLVLSGTVIHPLFRAYALVY